jgi:hypothetical protein
MAVSGRKSPMLNAWAKRGLVCQWVMVARHIFGA